MLVCAIALFRRMYSRESSPDVAPAGARKDGDSWTVDRVLLHWTHLEIGEMSRWKDSRHRHGARPSRSKRVPRDRPFHASRHFEVLEQRTLLSVYYVAVNGSDAAAGTIGDPFKTFRPAVASQPGDTIYVRGGTYTKITRRCIAWTHIPPPTPLTNLNSSEATTITFSAALFRSARGLDTPSILH